ncbi:hypothetical protein [Niallia oryzisoli]|uniref:hypothetical protein n=1 Tax=Niallia oryzisoli TaxID=1737571 RepID=UPI0037365148
MKRKIWLVIDMTILVVLILTGVRLFHDAKEHALNKIDTPINLEITLKDVSLLSNQSVGDSWETGLKVNEHKLQVGNTLVLESFIDEEITFNAGAVEHDNIPDVGTSNYLLKVSDLNLAEENLLEMDVSVKENRGRYSGNYARFEFLISIKRKVDFYSIIQELI